MQCNAIEQGGVRERKSFKEKPTRSRLSEFSYPGALLTVLHEVPPTASASPAVAIGSNVPVADNLTLVLLEKID
jgi:hypothetical protein